MSNLLDLTSFNNAINQLEQGLTEAGANAKDQLMRDGVIHRFVCAYERSHKMLKRFLVETSATAQPIEEMSFPTLIRTGFERELLLHSWDKWTDYRTAHSTTSHAYDAEKADAIFAVIPAFLNDVRYLRDQIAKRQALS